MDAAAFVEVVRRNPINDSLIDRLPGLGLPQCHLVAGCLFQDVWNARAGLPAGNAIKDYDVFYFDPDTSWDAEDGVIRRVNAAFADLEAPIEVRNQARVHLWYQDRFGADYPRLQSARDGIDRYLIECTCVGIEVATGELYAPNGFDDLERGVLRINPRNPQPDGFAEKTASHLARWPWLTIDA